MEREKGSDIAERELSSVPMQRDWKELRVVNCLKDILKKSMLEQYNKVASAVSHRGLH